MMGIVRFLLLVVGGKHASSGTRDAWARRFMHMANLCHVLNYDMLENRMHSV
jgi:hypothetical protein